MKQFLLLLSLIALFSLNALGQFVDSRLEEVFSETYIQNLTENHPNDLDYLNWYLDNSYVIIEISPEKCEYLPYLKHFDPVTKSVGENVIDLDQENLNVYRYSFERLYDKSTTYRIGDSGKAIVFISQKDLATNFNKHQNGE